MAFQEGTDASLRVEVYPVPWPPGADDLLRNAMVPAKTLPELAGVHHRVLSIVPVTDDSGRLTRLHTTVYDYENERTLVVDAPADDPENVTVSSPADQPTPSNAEYTAAVGFLRHDEHFGPALRDGQLLPYRPMPPVLAFHGSGLRPQRTITVGLRPADDKSLHEIVGVVAASGAIVRFDDGAPPGSRADEEICGDYVATEPVPKGTPGTALVGIFNEDELVWSFLVVRPSSSSGVNGSGVELRNVLFEGQLIIRRAHVSILNVKYDEYCGPYRDWLNKEDRFEAIGNDAAAPWFRVCTQRPRTILESGGDTGDFAGVAFFEEQGEALLVSEMQADWYRYVSEWRFSLDGTIKARLGFGATTSSCTCRPHTHHAYWRFHFARQSEDMQVHEFNDPPLDHDPWEPTSEWHRIGFESRRPHDPTRHRFWELFDGVARDDFRVSATLTPGLVDGQGSDTFGVGQLWAIRGYDTDDELDDGAPSGLQPEEVARANIDRFVDPSNELAKHELVLWYAGHFRHEQPGLPVRRRRPYIGPDLNLKMGRGGGGGGGGGGPGSEPIARVLIDPRRWEADTQWDAEGPSYLPDPPWAAGGPHYTWVRGKTTGRFVYKCDLPIDSVPSVGRVEVGAMVSSAEFREWAAEPRYSDVTLVVNGVTFYDQLAVSLYEETTIGWVLPINAVIPGQNVFEFRVGQGEHSNGLIFHYEPLRPFVPLRPITVGVYDWVWDFETAAPRTSDR